MKFSVVGLGLMGNLHARILADLAGPENVVGIEIDPDRAAAARDGIGIKVTEELSEVLDDVSAVSVTLPDHLHVQSAVAALQAGKYVLVEKPLATNTAQCAEILAAQTTPNRLMVGQLLRFDLRLRELKDRLVTGAMGELRYVRIRRANSTAIAQKLAGRVPVTAFLGVHDLDLLLWLTGQQIVRAQAAGRHIFGPVADLCVANLDMSGGTLATIENHWLVHPAAARSCLAEVEIFGSTGMALLELSTAELEVVEDSKAASKRIDTRNWTHDRTVSGGSLRRELETFTRVAAGRCPPPVTGEDGAAAVAAVEIVERALATYDSLPR